MANLQAIGFDGETIIHLLADGTGTDLDPFVSKFALTDGTITAIENILPEFVFDGDRLRVLTELSQPLTLTELEGITVNVSEQNPLSLSGIESILTELTFLADRLKVDANVTLPNTYPVSGSVSVDNFPASQPVTGNFYPATQSVSFGSLPTGTNIIGGISNTSFGASQSGNWTVGVNNYSDLATLLANTTLQADVSGSFALDKTGLATDTNQATTNTTLSSINSKVPTLESGRTPVVLSAAQITALTPPTTVTANLGTIAGVATAANQSTIIGHIDGIESALAGTINTNIINASVPVTGNFYQATQPVSIASLPALPTGTNTIGSIANTQFAVTQSGSWTIGINNFPVVQAVTGTVIANTGLDISALSTATNQTTTNNLIGEVTEATPSTDTASSGLNGRLQRIAQRLTSLIGLFPSSLGSKTAANSFAVTLASDGVASGISTQIGEVQTTPTTNTVLDRLKTIAVLLSGTIRNNPINAGTPTLTNVASSATSVTLIAANANRKTLIIVNDSTATLYLKFDASTASSTSYSHVLPPITNGIPYVLSLNGSDYSGEIRGIWSSANGFARITEIV